MKIITKRKFDCYSFSKIKNKEKLKHLIEKKFQSIKSFVRFFLCQLKIMKFGKTKHTKKKYKSYRKCMENCSHAPNFHLTFINKLVICREFGKRIIFYTGPRV